MPGRRHDQEQSSRPGARCRISEGRRALDDPVDPHRQDAGGHGGRPAVVGRVAAASRRTGPAHRARRVVRRGAAPLGIVGFVFEGWPNVFADAAGAAHGQFGRAAHRLRRASHGRGDHRRGARAGARCGGPSRGFREPRPRGRSRRRVGTFDDRRLALAVARGSGQAVSQLGAVARQAGTPLRLHGTGGSWLIAGESADPAPVRTSVLHSVDCSVCNTLNVCCLPRTRPDLPEVFLAAFDEAAAPWDEGHPPRRAGVGRRSRLSE